MADEAKVPGKAASAVKDSAKDVKDAAEKAVHETAPTVRGRWKAFRNEPDVKELEDTMKPVLPPVAFAAAAIFSPPLAAAGAAYVAVKRFQHRHDVRLPEDTTPQT